MTRTMRRRAVVCALAVGAVGMTVPAVSPIVGAVASDRNDVAAALEPEPATPGSDAPPPTAPEPETPAPSTSEPGDETPTPPTPTETTVAGEPAVAATTPTTTPPTTPTTTPPTTDVDDAPEESLPADTTPTRPAVAALQPGDVILLTVDPSGTFSIDKTNTADGEPAGDDTTAEPGDSYTYNISVACTSIITDCVDLTVTDSFPADVIVDQSTLPASIPGFRTVTYDAGTQTLTVVYTQTLDNPPGETGLQSGGSDNLIVSVTLPADTPLVTGDTIANTAVATGLDNTGQPSQAPDESNVVVNVPLVLDAGATKAFTDGNAVAGDPDATTTMQLGGTNLSSSSAAVDELTIEDSTPDTFDYLDVTAVRVTAFPEGADQAQVFVCPSANAPCDSDDDYVAGGTAAPPAPAGLSLPGTVPSDDVVGVRVVFTAPDGTIIPSGATAAVEVDMALRETVRSTGEVIAEIPSTTVIDNQSTTTVVDPDADPTSASASASAQYQILPPTLTVTPSKTIIADGNGNYQTNAGEHAVIGENSGVSMLIDATNESAFAISEIVITEPAPPPAPPSEWEKFDASEIRLTFPAGAASAEVVLTFEGGATATTNYPAPGPTTIDITPPPRVTSITVTFTGDPGVDGGNTIAAGATAGVDIHGNLNDNVDASDVGNLAGIDNCAHMDAVGTPYPGGTGTAAGNACATLPIEERNADTGGTKVPSQLNLPVDQPVVFTLTTTNNGNLPLIDLVVSDPPAQADGTPPTPTQDSVWYWGQFVDATVTGPAADRVTVEVYTPAGGWQLLGLVDPADYRDVIAVRGLIATLNPTESFSLNVGMTARVPLPDGVVPATLTNCYGITADTSAGSDEYDAEVNCSPPIVPSPVTEAASLDKFISPESMPFQIPGMTPQTATVELQIRNTGTLAARTLQITDDDADFWDAVDFAGFGSITAPAVGALRDANRIQIDAFVDGAWVIGTPTAPSSPTLPAGVANDEVRGLRFTFSDTSTLNDGFVLTNCPPTDQTCAGIVDFQVSPRLTLVSTGEPLPRTAPCPAPAPAPTGCAELLDSATGAFTTQLHPDDPAPIAEVTDNLVFVPGDPALDVDKGPENSTVQPGQIALFDLVTTNSGTANLPDVTVSDPLPPEITFNDAFADPDTGLPYSVVWSNLPEGYPEPPDAVFEPTPDPLDPTRVGMVRWTFPGFEMPPNATVTITFSYTLAPGVTAGQQIVNTMGASSPVDDLVCSDANDGEFTDGDFGDGLYCTDPANVTVTAGASFASRKWVAGNPALGWYNEATGELVPVGGGGCLSLAGPEGTYTTNPCIALVNPGEDFHYILRIQNAGTESAVEMTVVDSFPAPGDTGIGGESRGTQWATAPTLAGPAVYNGAPTGTIEYSTGTPCASGFGAWPCDDVSWSGDPAGAAALRMNASFDPDRLPPGGVVDVYFSMTAPQDVPRVADPTVAYNSLAHSEVTDVGNGSTRRLPPLEPLRVGVGTLYGNLQVLKQIGDNPANLPLDDVEFTFTYDCTLTNGEPWSGNGTVTATPSAPGDVTGIPSGSTCEVTETGTNGGVASAPVIVTIDPSLDPDAPVVSTAEFTNDFPLGQLEVVKDVTGVDDPDFLAMVAGPYPVTVECAFLGEPVDGFPVDTTVTVGTPTIVTPAPPVGAECTVTETADLDASSVTYDPPGGVMTVTAGAPTTVTVTITNDFPPAYVSLLKEVTGGVDPVFTAGPYTAELVCTFNAQVLPGFDPAVQVVLEPGVPSPAFEVPAGSVCTATETDAQGATTVTYEPANTAGTAGEVVVPEGTTEIEPISIVVTNDFPVGGLQVNKAIGRNDANLVLDDLPYLFRYQCTFDPNTTVAGDEIVSPDPAGLLVATVNDPAEVTGLPAGAVCEVWETQNPGNQGGIPSNPEDNPAVVTIEASTTAQPLTPVTITNDYPSVAVALEKLVDGDARSVFTRGPYAIAVTCWATDQVPGVGAPLPGTPVVLEVFADEPVEASLPVGTVCWFEELDVPDGVTVTYDPATPSGDAGIAVVPAVEPPDGEVVGSVSVTNTFEAGSLVIEKTVSGPGAPTFSQGPFVFGVSCGYQGVDDLYTVAVVVPGSADGSPVQSEPVTGLPIGAECTVTEIDNGGADLVADPQTVTIVDDQQANVAVVGVDNPFSAGSIAVAKTVDGTAADSAYVAGLEYTIAIECAVDVNGTLVTVLDRDVSAAGDGVPVTVVDDVGDPALLPLGARCWGSEPDTQGAASITIAADSYANGVEVVADTAAGIQALQIDVTNTFEAASLTVTKQVVNQPGPGAWTFDVACTRVGADGSTQAAPLLTGTSPVTLADGASATFTVLVGSRCTVVERAAPGAIVTIAETSSVADADPTDGVVDVVDDVTVTVTNTYPSDAAAGGGLAQTGAAGVRSTTVLAVAVTAVGLLFLAIGRLRRRPLGP